MKKSETNKKPYTAPAAIVINIETELMLATSGMEKGDNDFKNGGSYGRGNTRNSTIWDRSESNVWN